MIRLFAEQERERTRKKIADPLALLSQQRDVAAIARTIAAQLALGSARWPSSLADCADESMAVVAAVRQPVRRCVGVSGVGPAQRSVFLPTGKQRQGPCCQNHLALACASEKTSSDGNHPRGGQWTNWRKQA